MMEAPKQISSWVDEAVKLWKLAGIELQIGVPLTVIESFEKQLDFIFPEDFKELYQNINGFRDFEWNEHMFSLWSLERIVKEYQEDGNRDFVGICDFLINSHSIGFSKIHKKICKGYALDQSIASTFKETIILLNEDSELLY